MTAPECCNKPMDLFGAFISSDLLIGLRIYYCRTVDQGCGKKVGLAADTGERYAVSCDEERILLKKQREPAKVS